MGRLILVRHGETTLNAERRYQGRVDPPLSERGTKQAESLRHVLARAVAEPTPNARAQDSSWQVHVSPALRCRQTARVALAQSVAHIDQRLAELDFGAFDGRTYEENLEAHGDGFRAWTRDPDGVRPPGGETLAELRMRVDAWLELLPLHYNVVAFTHAGPIRAALAHLLGLPFADTWEVEVGLGEALSIPLDGASILQLERLR